MAHLDEGQVQRLLHRELIPAETSAREHLAVCADCRGRVAAAEREEHEVDALLHQVDHPPPRIDANTVATKARAQGFRLRPWAAGILLMLGLAGAAYAAPGSPLPAWVKAVVERVSGRSESAAAPAPAQVPNPGFAGIAVTPGGELVLLFTSTQSEGQVQVSLTDGAEAVVRAVNGAATFTADVDRLVIDNQGSSASFEIEIPRTAPRVEIRVGGVRVFLKEGSRITLNGSAERRGPYLLPLTAPGS